MPRMFSKMCPTGRPSKQCRKTVITKFAFLFDGICYNVGILVVLKVSVFNFSFLIVDCLLSHSHSSDLQLRKQKFDRPDRSVKKNFFCH